MTCGKSWDLVADIGGTNTRLARLLDGQIDRKTTHSTGGSGSIMSALETYCRDLGTAPKRVMIAVAGTVTGGAVKVTNGEDRIELAAIRQSTGSADVQLINDFEAAAWSLATVSRNDITALQGPAIAPPGHRIILGAGTGLGVGALIATPTGFLALPGEGGHVGISPASDFERDVFAALAKLWPEIEIEPNGAVVEAEAFLSGTGIPVLHQSVCAAMNLQTERQSAGQIFAKANTGEPTAAKTIEIFAAHLARVAGNLAVSISPKGGVYFAGGVIQANNWILNDTFLEHFNNGGRFTAFRKSFPVYLYENPDVGLIGASNALTFG